MQIIEIYDVYEKVQTSQPFNLSVPVIVYATVIAENEGISVNIEVFSNDLGNTWMTLYDGTEWHSIENNRIAKLYLAYRARALRDAV